MKWGTHTHTLPSVVKWEENASTSSYEYVTRLVSRFHSLHRLRVMYVYLINNFAGRMFCAIFDPFKEGIILFRARTVPFHSVYEKVLWLIDSLLRGDSVNSCRC
jgi:hypothetical protein